MDTKKAHQQVNSSQWHLGMDHYFFEGRGGGGWGRVWAISEKIPALQNLLKEKLCRGSHKGKNDQTLSTTMVLFLC